MMTTDDFINELKKALGDNLISVVLYGSAVTGDATKNYSDVNIFLLLNSAAIDKLKPALPAAHKWFKQGQAAPLFFSQKDFKHAEDVFPIEFSDIKENHRVAYGTDPFAGVQIKPADLRHQLEFELRSKYIQLRQRYLEVEGAPTPVKNLMAKALSSFSALFKSALRLTGDIVPSQKVAVWKALERHAPIDVEGLEKIWSLRQGQTLPDKDVEPVFSSLLKSIEATIEFVDKKK